MKTLRSAVLGGLVPQLRIMELRFRRFFRRILVWLPALRRSSVGPSRAGRVILSSAILPWPRKLAWSRASPPKGGCGSGPTKFPSTLPIPFNRICRSFGFTPVRFRSSKGSSTRSHATCTSRFVSSRPMPLPISRARNLPRSTTRTVGRRLKRGT